MAGVEYARAYSWGASPDRKVSGQLILRADYENPRADDLHAQGDYEKASPCQHIDLPQTLLEPILTRRAVSKGFPIRFSTTFDRFEEVASSTIVSLVTDTITKIQYQIESKYLFGADGARSRIQRQLDLPLLAQAPQGVALNVLLRADLSRHIKARMGNCHFVMQPDRQHPLFGWLCVARMVKPWYEWLFILFPSEAVEDPGEIAKEAYVEHVQNLLGDPSIAVEVLGVSKWVVNEIVAKEYSRGNMYVPVCSKRLQYQHASADFAWETPFTGTRRRTDSVRIHVYRTPTTSRGKWRTSKKVRVADQYFWWKPSFFPFADTTVVSGLASPRLLETYSTERQPVGVEIVTRANDSYRAQQEVWKALGLLTADASIRKENMDQLADSTEVGRQRRKAFRDSIHGTRMEFHALGTEMGQRYQSMAVIQGPGDEEKEKLWSQRDKDTRVLEYLPSTQPGRRLPHVWLNSRCPRETSVSTQDLAGKRAFTLFTGHGGEVWRTAATHATSSTKVDLKVYSIGVGLDWEDVYLDWERLRGVEESGCVLVRPDRFVAWRSPEALTDEEQCSQKLIEVLRSILGWDGPRCNGTLTR